MRSGDECTKHNAYAAAEVLERSGLICISDSIARPNPPEPWKSWTFRALGTSEKIWAGFGDENEKFLILKQQKIRQLSWLN